jgi:hypothetical protein
MEMKYSELLPPDAIKKLINVIQIWFRTDKQTQKITEALKPYEDVIIKNNFQLNSLVSLIENSVTDYNKKNKGKRVIVYNGDNTKIIGHGTYIGRTKVWVYYMPDGSLRSASNAENKPNGPVPAGAVLKQLDDNPKIVLDNGQVVYGAQVWWKEVPSNKDVFNPEEEIGVYQWN